MRQHRILARLVLATAAPPVALLCDSLTHPHTHPHTLMPGRCLRFISHRIPDVLNRSGSLHSFEALHERRITSGSIEIP